jgi:hypothetical protein
MKKTTASLIMFACLMACYCPGGSWIGVQTIQADAIHAGTSARAITPDLDRHEIFLAGFGMNRRATGVHDDLWSRCLCLKIGERTIAIVSVDLVGMMFHEYLAVLERLPGNVHIDMVLLTSTHNHEGPDVIGIWGPHFFKTGVTWEWYHEAMDIIATSITEAYYSMQPAGIRLGHAEAPGLARDSRDPVIIEEQVETLQAVDEKDFPIATVIFYANHPEVLWDENTLITSDYPHYIYEYIQDNTGGNAVFVSGPLGGLITPKVTEHTFAEAQRIGETVAEAGLTSLEGTPIIRDTVMRVNHRALFIPMTNIMFRLASLLKLIDRPVYHFRLDLLTAVSVVEIGEGGNLVQMIGVPGEDFPENWFEIKEKMHAEHRMHMGLCPDELGYIVPIEDWDWFEYEESMSASIYLDQRLHDAVEGMLTLRGHNR